MSKNDREAFLAGLHVGVLSVARAADEGRGPLTVPIWYDYEPGGDVWMITGETSIKHEVLKAAGYASFCVQEEAPPYSYVVIDGPVTFAPATNEQLLHMATRYLGEEQGAAYASQGTGEGMMIASIKTATWNTIDYGKDPALSEVADSL